MSSIIYKMSDMKLAFFLSVWYDKIVIRGWQSFAQNKVQGRCRFVSFES